MHPPLGKDGFCHSSDHQRRSQDSLSDRWHRTIAKQRLTACHCRKKWWQVRDFPSFSHIYRFLAESLKQAAPVSFKEMGAACCRLPFRLFLQPDCVLSAAFCVSHSFVFLLPDLAYHEPQAVLRLGVIACVIGETDAARQVKTQEIVAGAAVGDADASAFEVYARDAGAYGCVSVRCANRWHARRGWQRSRGRTRRRWRKTPARHALFARILPR